MTRRAAAVRARWAAPWVAALLVVGGACGDDGEEVQVGADPGTEEAATGDDAGNEEAATDDATSDETGTDEAATEDGGGDSGGELPDACALIPRDELQELLGLTEMQRTDEEAIDGLAFSECVWQTDDVALAGVAVVETSARYDQRVELAEDEFLMEPEMIDDLGDGAVVAVGVSLESFAATGGRTATVLSDGYSVEIALRLDPSTSTDDVVALAETVLARL
jgi:hypothetical protein